MRWSAKIFICWLISISPAFSGELQFLLPGYREPAKQAESPTSTGNLQFLLPDQRIPAAEADAVAKAGELQFLLPGHSAQPVDLVSFAGQLEFLLPDDRALTADNAVAYSNSVQFLLPGDQPPPAEAARQDPAATAPNRLPELPILTPPVPELAAPREYIPPVGPSSPEGRYLLQDGWLDRFGQCYESAKRCNNIPITIGAWHWWHIDTGGPNPSGYGIPGENGTFYYSLEASPEFNCNIGPFQKAGAYVDVRFRDGGTPLRPYYPGETWLYQGYGWAWCPEGVLKAGAVWRRFGLDWDGSWWGSTPYYDGFMLSTGWGVSWEQTPTMEDGFKVDRFFQFFFADNVDESLVGADPMSVLGSSERNTCIARVVPTVQLSDNSTLALGISGLVGEIRNADELSLAGRPQVYASPGDQTLAAWAVDLTYTRGQFKAFIEGLQAYGVLSPARYVSGGASNRTTDLLAGFNWTQGPITYRASYSLSLDDNPSGTQRLFVPGVTVALTRNVELYTEYVLQEVRASGQSDAVTYENGMQMVLHWHF